MRLIFLFILSLVGPGAIGQSVGKPESTNTVVSSSAKIPVIVPGKQYQQVIANPGNANAWLDYYKWIGANKEFSTAEKQQFLSQTIASSKNFIVASWQFSLMNFIQSGKRNKVFLDAALQQSGDKTLIYPYAIQFAVITQDGKLLNEYARAFNDLSPLSPALYEYHYNVLMSADANAMIYAKGLTDIAPMAVLQQVYGIRKDIHFRYYEEKITDGNNTYVCLSAGKDIIRQYPGAAYTGLLVKISGDQTPGVLKKIAASFRLSELTNLQSLDENEKAIYHNYLPFFILQYRSCKAINDPAAENWKQYALKTGRLTGSSETVNKILSE